MVLLIDPDRANRQFVEAVLEVGGFRYMSCSGAEEALSLARRHLFCVVLMEVSLPGVHGVEVMRRMQCEALMGDVPFIAVTARAMLGDREWLLDAGFVHYAPKPVSVEELLSVVALYVRYSNRCAPTRIAV